MPDFIGFLSFKVDFISMSEKKSLVSRILGKFRSLEKKSKKKSCGCCCGDDKESGGWCCG